jgi:hypothetical protein
VPLSQNTKPTEQQSSFTASDAGSGPEERKNSVKQSRATTTRKIGAAALDEADELQKMEMLESAKPRGIVFRCSRPNCEGTQARAGQCEKCFRAPVRLVSNRAQNLRMRPIP